jgi:hypothetical protein
MEPSQIIAPGVVAKSSLFESCWIGERESEWGSQEGEWGEKTAE